MARKATETGAKEIEIAERRAAALRLRRAGLTLAQISEQTGVGVTQTHKDIKAALAPTIKEMQEDAEYLRGIELDRLDELTRALQKQMQTATGDEVLKIADRLIKVGESRRRLLGLDAPVEQRITGANGGAVQVHITWGDDD